MRAEEQRAVQLTIQNAQHVAALAAESVTGVVGSNGEAKGL